jgi:hypothetical protein
MTVTSVITCARPDRLVGGEQAEFDLRWALIRPVEARESAWSRRRICAAAIILSIRNDRPCLIYNGSGSAPIGFYRVPRARRNRGRPPFRDPRTPLSAYGLLPAGMPPLK